MLCVVFDVEIRRYKYDAKSHLANKDNPLIPSRRLSSVVAVRIHCALDAQKVRHLVR